MAPDLKSPRGDTPGDFACAYLVLFGMLVVAAPSEIPKQSYWRSKPVLAWQSWQWNKIHVSSPRASTASSADAAQPVSKHQNCFLDTGLPVFYYRWIGEFV